MQGWKCRRCRDPFDFAQGMLFDSAGTSLGEVPAALRMTDDGENQEALTPCNPGLY